MKRTVQIILVMLMSLTLVSCGKEEVEKPIEKPELVNRVEILTLLENADFTKFLNSRNQITLMGEFDRTSHDGEPAGESVLIEERVHIPNADIYLIPLKKKEDPEENIEAKEEGEETPEEEIVRGILQLNAKNIDYKKVTKNYNLEGNKDGDDIIESIKGSFESVFKKEGKGIFDKNYIYLNPDFIKTENGIEKVFTTKQKVPQSALAPSVIEAIQSIITDLVYFEAGDLVIADLLLQKISQIENIELTKEDSISKLNFSVEKDEIFKIAKEIIIKIIQTIDNEDEIDFELPFIIKMIIAGLDIELPNDEMSKDDFIKLVEQINEKAASLDNFKISSEFTFNDGKINNINIGIKMDYNQNVVTPRIDKEKFNLDFNINFKVVPSIPNLPNDLKEYLDIKDFPFKSDQEIKDMNEIEE